MKRSVKKKYQLQLRHYVGVILQNLLLTFITADHCALMINQIMLT
uniref:Casein kinase I isoform delta-like isoform X1 n=1 Tax=Rhizophora mucronata TaxID=61149 RepID=A0A2P2LRC2_RHIMU